VIDCDAEIYNPSLSPDVQMMPATLLGGTQLPSVTMAPSVISGGQCNAEGLENRMASFDLHPSTSASSIRPSVSNTGNLSSLESPTQCDPRNAMYSASSSGYYSSLSPSITTPELEITETVSPLGSSSEQRTCESNSPSISSYASLPCKVRSETFSSSVIRTFVSVNEPSQNLSVSSRTATECITATPPSFHSSFTLDSVTIPECDYPPGLTEMQYDAVVLCSKTDIEHSTTFKLILSKFIKLLDGREPAICMIDDNQ